MSKGGKFDFQKVKLLRLFQKRVQTLTTRALRVLLVLMV